MLRAGLVVFALLIGGPALAQVAPCSHKEGEADLTAMRCATFVAARKLARAAQVEADLETQVEMLRADLAQQKALAGWWEAAGRALWPTPSEAAPAPKAE